MCVICVKEKGVRMPTESEIIDMWERNPHGAGFMFARGGSLHVSKGYMTMPALLDALQAAGIQEGEPLVLHFRISTQGGINPEMCHPFPVSRKLADMTALECSPDVAIAHNGIIERCSKPNSMYSDTALFVTRYVSELMRTPADVGKAALLESIAALAPNNRFAIMNAKGKIATVGRFERIDGLLYSNTYHMRNYRWWRK